MLVIVVYSAKTMKKIEFWTNIKNYIQPKQSKK